MHIRAHTCWLVPLQRSIDIVPDATVRFQGGATNTWEGSTLSLQQQTATASPSSAAATTGGGGGAGEDGRKRLSSSNSNSSTRCLLCRMESHGVLECTAPIPAVAALRATLADAKCVLPPVDEENPVRNSWFPSP